MSYNYALSKILPTFATFTNEFSPFFPLLYPPFYTSAYSSFRQTLLLSIQNSFSSISLLLPPSSPPVKISNFHPPSLSCIPPEGRLSSFPISSPLSLSAPSLVPPHLPDSFYRSSANSHGGGGGGPPRADARSLVICQRCQLGWRETSPDTYPRPLLYVRSNLGEVAPRYHPRYQGEQIRADRAHRVTQRRIAVVKRQLDLFPLAGNPSQIRFPVIKTSLIPIKRTKKSTAESHFWRKLQT